MSDDNDTCKIMDVENLDAALNLRSAFRLRHPLPQIFSARTPSFQETRYALALQIEDVPVGVGDRLSLEAARARSTGDGAPHRSCS